jgi:hypothetical protein
MRLINTRTLELKQFNSGSIPTYAILSHAWEEEEVILQELHTSQARQKKGFKKIEDFCSEAAARGHEWGWMDTCCIDKTDLVELSQAINSMFAWYRDSTVCLAYLSDFHLQPHGSVPDNTGLKASRWFTRGWTLQELIAPKHVAFYDSQWRFVGTKHDLSPVISRITGISPSLLEGRRSLQDFSSAQKMSWAAYRETTRTEDRAYSLLGMFNICFPLMYGEGWRAFGRLQEEILKVSTDQSIFAWTQNGPLNPLETSNIDRRKHWSIRHRCSILAPTPDCFYDSASVVCAPTAHYTDHPLLAEHISGVDSMTLQGLNKPITFASTGLQITLLVKCITVIEGQCLLEAMLNCHAEGRRERKITIFLVVNAELLCDAEYISARSTPVSGTSTPAWRVEPYHLGTVTWHRGKRRYPPSAGARTNTKKKSMAEESHAWIMVPLSIHPIHPVWPALSGEVHSVVSCFRQKHVMERMEAEKRIFKARKYAPVAVQDKHLPLFNILAGFVVVSNVVCAAIAFGSS